MSDIIFATDTSSSFDAALITKVKNIFKNNTVITKLPPSQCILSVYFPSYEASISDDIRVSVINNLQTVTILRKTYKYWNNCLKVNRFPNLMKVAKISSVFKKLVNTFIDDYRPISKLSNFAKFFKSIICLQLSGYTKNKFSKYLTVIRKNHDTQNSFLGMTKSRKSKLNNGSKVGVIILDLSKAFDSLRNDSLLAKLEEYGLGNNAVTLWKQEV